MPFDETWAFVTKKEKNGRPADTRCGDGWDHVALDPETRRVVSLVVGKRTAEATRALVRDFRRRTGGRAMRLMTSRPGRPRKPYTAASPGVTDATVHKERENNRVVRVSTRVVFGTAAAVARAAAAVGRSGGEHEFRGTAQRDGPEPVPPQGAEELCVLEGLGGPPGGECVQLLQL